MMRAPLAVVRLLLLIVQRVVPVVGWHHVTQLVRTPPPAWLFALHAGLPPAAGAAGRIGYLCVCMADIFTSMWCTCYTVLSKSV